MRKKKEVCPIVLSSIVLLLLLIIILSNVLLVAAESPAIPDSPLTQNQSINEILIGIASTVIGGIVLTMVLDPSLGMLKKSKEILRRWIEKIKEIIKRIEESLNKEIPIYKILRYAVLLFILLIGILLVGTYISRENTDLLHSKSAHPDNPKINNPSVEPFNNSNNTGTKNLAIESVNESDTLSDNNIATNFSESQETTTFSSTDYVNVDVVLKDGGVIKNAKLHFVAWGWGPYNVTTFKFTDNLDSVKNEENVPNNITREFKLNIIKRMDFIDLNEKDSQNLDSVKSWDYQFDRGDVRKVNITLRDDQIYENIYIFQIGVYETPIESGTIQDTQIKAIVFK